VQIQHEFNTDEQILEADENQEYTEKSRKGTYEDEGESLLREKYQLNISKPVINVSHGYIQCVVDHSRR
jgi:hypothetical protein